MKKTYVLIFVVLSFFSCSKEDNPLFRIVFNPVTISVSPTMSAFEEHAFLVRVQTNFKNTFNANGLSPDSVNYIRPISAKISRIFDGDLRFVETMSIRICPVGSSNITNCGMEAFWREEDFSSKLKPEINLVNSNIEDIQDIVLNDEVEVQIIFEELWDRPIGNFDIQARLEFGVW